jgi:hypothetical protein
LVQQRFRAKKLDPFVGRLRDLSGRSVFCDPSFGVCAIFERAADRDAIGHLSHMPRAGSANHRKLRAVIE